MPRYPKGILSRNVPDWYFQKLFSVEIAVGGVAGQGTNCGVYNNSQNGAVYYFYYVSIFVSASSFVNFKYEKGKNYPTFTINSPQPIDPRIGAGSAIAEGGNAVSCLGTHVGGMTCNTGANPPYAPGWPFLIIPPGYAGVIEGDNPNITVQVALSWLELRGGGF